MTTISMSFRQTIACRDEHEFFSTVCEKLDYTSNTEPDPEDRQYGWINPDEFRKWLTREQSACLERTATNN